MTAPHDSLSILSLLRLHLSRNTSISYGTVTSLFYLYPFHCYILNSFISFSRACRTLIVTTTILHTLPFPFMFLLLFFHSRAIVFHPSHCSFILIVRFSTYRTVGSTWFPISTSWSLGTRFVSVLFTFINN